MKGINTWAVSLIRYSGPFLNKDHRRPQTNRTENKKTNDHTQGIASQR